MYIYFDSTGKLKEIITEDVFRVGDSKRDKIYVYWEGDHSPLSGWVKYRKPDGTDSNETQFFISGETSLVGKELPTKPLRNLKYFSYDHTYEDSEGTHIGYLFYEITVPTEVINSSVEDDTEPSENNLVVARIRFIFADEEIESLGVVPFSVETNMGILTDSSINISQYNYLLSVINGYCTTEEVEDMLAYALVNVYKFQGSKTVAQLNELEVTESMHGYVYNVLDSGTLTQGSVVVSEGDNVAIVWDELNWHWDKLAGIGDLSNYVTTNTAQEISGAKTLTSDLTLYAESGNSPQIVFQRGTPSDALNDWSIIDSSGFLQFRTRTSSDTWNPVIQITSNSIVPLVNNTKDIGGSAVTFKDLYLGGNANIGGKADFGFASILYGASNLQVRRNDGNRLMFYGDDSSMKFRTVIPMDTTQYDLGASNFQWKDLYLAGDIGKSGSEIGDVYLNTGKKVNFKGSNYNCAIKNEGNRFIVEYAGSNKFFVGNTDAQFAVNEVRPYADNTSDLGDSSHQWKDLYLGGKVYFDTDKYIYVDSSNRLCFSNNSDRLKITASGDIQYVANAVPLITNQYDLGSSTFNWKDLYLGGKAQFGSNANTYITANNDGDLMLRGGGGCIWAYQQIKPINNGTQDLGGSNAKWKDLYLGGYTLFFNGGNYWGVTATNSGHFRINKNGSDVLEIRNNLIFPISSNSVSLGTNAQLFRNIFVANEISDGTNTVTVAQLANMNKLTVSSRTANNVFYEVVKALKDNQDLGWGRFSIVLSYTCPSVDASGYLTLDMKLSRNGTLDVVDMHTDQEDGGNQFPTDITTLQIGTQDFQLSDDYDSDNKMEILISGVSQTLTANGRTWTLDSCDVETDGFCFVGFGK